MSGIFATEAPRYRAAGFWPRPIELGSKACKIKGWQRSDSEIGEPGLNRWLEQCGQQGIGLLMGSPLPDGTALGALDIDRDEYVRVTRFLLGDPVCGRIGGKGAVFFVRVAPGVRNRKFRVGGKSGEQIADALFDKNLCVIPPTIHPVTDQPYRWIDPSKSLREVDPATLPLIGE
jgi:hypothetical protein